MKPMQQFVRAFLRAVVGSRVSPFAQADLDEAFGLANIRHVICGAFFVLLFLFWNGLMVSPSGTWGTGSTKVQAGRQ